MGPRKARVPTAAGERRTRFRPPASRRHVGRHAAASRILEEARKDGEAIRKEAQTQARDLVVQAKADWEREARDQRQELGAVEQRVAQKEASIDRKIEAFAQLEPVLGKREDAL